MKKFLVLTAALSVVALAALVAVVKGTGPSIASASSHREAPLISEDPSADLTDLYAFRSPDKPNTLTVIANVLPGEDPAAGPNWYTFSPTARYNLKIDTNGDVKPDVIYRFQFGRKNGPFFLGDSAQRTPHDPHRPIGSLAIAAEPEQVIGNTALNEPLRALDASGLHRRAPQADMRRLLALGQDPHVARMPVRCT